MPDYVTLSYEFVIWTSYIEQMNRIVEKINYSDGAYWGEPGKMRFRTQIESFSDSSEIDGERLIKTTFNVNLYGYILPETYNNSTTTQKYLSPKKLIMRENADTTLLATGGQSQTGGSSTVDGVDSPRDFFSISVSKKLTLTQGTGVTISNSGIGFDGSSALTQVISIGQPVAVTDNVVFNQVTASNALQIGSSTTKYTSTGISGSIDITGSLATTGNLTVQGDTTIVGRLTANEFHTTFTSASILFDSGSTKFGDDTNDKHQFTGSADITGSFKLNGYQITEISNDTSLADGSENDFIFFINGQYMEHDALTIQQAGSNFLLKVDTSSMGYVLESDDEILGIGKFNS